MKSVNRITILGHVANSPELKKTKSDRAVCSFPVATNRFIVAKDGKKEETADFHRIVAWGKMAEVAAKHLDKGCLVYIEGTLVNNAYDDKEGIRRYKSEIYMKEMSIITWKKKDGESEETAVIEKVAEQKAEPVAV